MTLTIEAHGSSYRIEDPDGLIGKALRSGEPYEAKVLEHIYRRGFEGLAVDVGASVGNHSLWFAAVCGLRVIAVEPLDHRRLQRNVEINDLDIKVWPVALGEVSGRGSVTGPPSHVVGLPLPRDGRVATTRLDDMQLNELSLLKIDVEGMEPEVIRGGRETIARCRPTIYAEAQEAEAHERNAAELEALGYRHEQTFGATPLEEWLPC